MDSKDDITVKILIDIRDEIKGTNKRVDELQERVDGLQHSLQTEIGHLRNDLGQRITHSEIRVATAITEVAGSVNEVKTMLRDQLDLRDRVARCERDIDELKRRP